jgi:transposase
MDNVRFHDTAQVRRAVSGRGFVSVFTPPYSPWCNPIEMAFSKMKTTYRAHCETNPSSDVDDFVGRLLGSLHSVTAEDCRSYFAYTLRLVTGPLDEVIQRLR